MAYTKYSLTPANNTAAPPDGAPEGMLPSAVNDTMRDMMAQIRDVGDGVRDGTYTMTAPKITGGTINGATIGATTATTGKFSTLTNSALTSGRVTYAGASGLLSDSANLQFDGSNLGLGVTPSAWGSGEKAIQLAGTTFGNGVFSSSNNTSVIVGVNAYYSSTGYKRIVAAASSIIQFAVGETRFLTAGSSTADSAISFTQAMTLDASGNLLMGTTSSIGGKLQVLFDGTSGDGIGLKTNNATLDAVFIRFLNSAGSTAGNIYQNGTTSVSYATSSDYRLKENIVPMTGALAKVAQLKPVTYKWKSDGSDGQGFIAHELQEVVPDCVGGKKDAIDADGKPVYQGIDTSFLVATLTKAIQEQQALIESLTTRLTALENK